MIATYTFRDNGVEYGKNYYIFGVDRTAPFSDILESIQQGTCNPTTCGLNFVSYPSKASLTVNFERFTVRRLSYIPGNVKLWESPGRAGGLPTIIMGRRRSFSPIP